MRWGLTVPLTGVPLRDHRKLVAELGSLGYTDLWSAEVAGADAFTPLILASEWDNHPPVLPPTTSPAQPPAALSPATAQPPSAPPSAAAQLPAGSPPATAQPVAGSSPATAQPAAASSPAAAQRPAGSSAAASTSATPSPAASTSVASTSAAHSGRLRLGTAVVPVHTRGPAALAMSAAALADLAPGRFVLGIGASSETIVTGWNGIAYDPPLARTRDVLRFLRQAFAGEKVDGDFDSFTIRRFRLEKAPDIPPQIMLAALRPQMLRLARREADGAITNWLAASDVPQVRAELGPDKELAARIFVCCTEDTDMARNIGRFLIANYLTVPGYAAFHDWLGRADAMTPMREAWSKGDKNTAMAAIPTDLIDALIIHGTPAECRARITEYVTNGVDTPIIATLPTGTDPLETARLLAPTTTA